LKEFSELFAAEVESAVSRVSEILILPLLARSARALQISLRLR
jgi:hypothetical protein